MESEKGIYTIDGIAFKLDEVKELGPMGFVLRLTNGDSIFLKCSDKDRADLFEAMTGAEL